MVVRRTVRWAATHGAMRLAIRARARAGNPDAEVLSDPVVREDPYAHYERLRTAAPFAGGAFARVSVHHEVCTDVLRSDDFGQIGGSRTDGMPPLVSPDVMSRDFPAAVWGDAVVVVPWTLYERYGDPQPLTMLYPAMCRWVDGVRRRARDTLMRDSRA